MEQDWITNIDLDNKTGKKMKNPAAKMFKGMTKNDAKKFAKNMTDATNTDLKEIGTEKVAGVLCKVLLAETNMGGLKSTTKMWVYKNFNVKMESESMGTKVVEEAISFEENAKVPADAFKVPNGIDVQVIDINY